MNKSYLHMHTSISIKLIFSGLLALMLVACSSGSSNSSESGGNTTKKNQSSLIFKQSSITTTYEADKKISNTVTGGSGTGTITYSIDNTNVATIDAITGELTIKGAGTAKIIAIKAGDADYNPIANSYILTITKTNQSSLIFKQSSITTTYEADKKISNTVTGGSGTGTITYSIDNTSVATIDAITGELTIKGSGRAKITATNAGDVNHNPITNSYILTVNVIKFEFMQSQINRKYRADLTIPSNLIIEHIVRGQVRFKSDTTRVATVDNNGLLSIHSVGTATITAKRSTDSHSVRELTSTLSLTVTKGDQAALIFNQSELAVGLKKTTASNVATGGTGNGAITYSIDNTNVATIATHTGVVTLKSIGTATVTATKAADANYSTISNSYILTVNNKQDQPPLSFQQASITIDYQDGVTTSNIAQGGTGTGAISYRSDNTDIATVDNNGVVTIKSGGTVIIRATKAGDAIYNPTEASYELMVNKIAQSGFGFTQSTITLTYLTDKTTTNIPQGGQSKGAITYESSNKNVATVNDNGQVTINGAGTATITATKAEDTNYKAISSSYVLVVNKAQQTGFGFAKAVFSLAYVADGTTSNATVGEQGVGTVTYSIDNTSVATIATNTGIVTLKGVGRAKITANKAEDSNYQAATSSYVLVVTKGKQTGFGFARSTVTLTYLTDETTTNVAEGGQSEGTITYSIDNTSVATVDSDGQVTINGAGTAIITAIRAEDTTYQAIASSYVLVVHKAQQTGFRFSKDVFTVAYSKDKKISNIIPQGGQGEGAITYEIDKTSVATIDSTNGVLTLKSIGTATVTATKDGDEDYLPTSATYVLNVSRELSITLGSIKNIKFAWNATTDTNYYRLESDLGNGAGFVDASTSGFVVTPNNTNIKQTTARADIVLHRYVPLVDGPQYQVEACDAGNTCHSTAYGFLTNVQLNELIGYFKASNTGEKDEFGTSVSISDDGNTLAVGAIGEASNSTGVDGVEDNSSATKSGAVYVFTRSSTGTWRQQAYIKASNADKDDEFGYSVSISGDGHSLAVGARFEDSNSTGVNGEENNSSATKSGAVYVFTRSGQSWSQQAYIKASNTGNNDEFGNSVSLSDDGNSLAVGAPLEDSNSTGVGGAQDNNDATDAGAAYFFTRSSTGTWNQQAYIKASNTGRGDDFGSSVSISGDGNTLVVGASFERGISTGVGGAQTRGNILSGAAYVFTRSTATLSQQAYIKPSSISNGSFYRFGWSVSLSDDGNSLAVGAVGEDSNSTGVDGAENNGDSFNSGAVYVFTRSSTGTWSQQTYIKASNSGTADQFGWSVSLSDDGNTLAVAAPFEDSNAKGVNGKQNNDDGNANQSGAVYVFTRHGTDWNQLSYIKASNSGADDAFGFSVSLSADGNSLAVGAIDESSTSTGVVNGVPAQDNSGAPDSGAVYLY